MKKLKPWQIISLVLIIGLFVGRIYVSRLQKKEREDQRRMIRELSEFQREQQQNQADSLYQQSMDSIMDRNRRSLDALQRNLDSIGRELEESGKRLNQQMGEK